MTHWCSCGGSNENCSSCYGLGTVDDDRPTAPVIQRTNPVEDTEWKAAAILRGLQRMVRPAPKRPVPCPVFGCSAQLNPLKLKKHLKKLHGNPPVSSQSPKVPEIQEAKRGTKSEVVDQLVACAVGGCSAKLKPSNVERHLRKVHPTRGIQSKPRLSVSSQFPAIPKIEQPKRERQREAVDQLVRCAVSGCTAKMKPSNVERHLRKVHLRGNQSKFRLAQTNIRNVKIPIGSIARYIVSNSIPNGSPRVSPYGQLREKNLDATKGYANAYRESGRFGSYPSHDGFGDESGPD